MLLSNPNSWGVLTERQGKILGSIFLHRFPPSPVAVIGPLAVRPSADGGVGRKLMNAALFQAHEQNYDQIMIPTLSAISTTSLAEGIGIGITTS
jgi:predicted N-acetyltransferase YhbS